MGIKSAGQSKLDKQDKGAGSTLGEAALIGQSQGSRKVGGDFSTGGFLQEDKALQMKLAGTCCRRSAQESSRRGPQILLWPPPPAL